MASHRLDSIGACQPTMRLLRLLIPALAIGVVVTIQVVYFNRGFIPGMPSRTWPRASV